MDDRPASERRSPAEGRRPATPDGAAEDWRSAEAAEGATVDWRSAESPDGAAVDWRSTVSSEGAAVERRAAISTEGAAAVRRSAEETEGAAAVRRSSDGHEDGHRRGDAGEADLRADAAHEMRGPIGAVVALADLLLARDLDQTDRHLAGLIRFAGQHLKALADRLEHPDAAPERRPVAPDDLLRTVAALHAPRFAEAGVRLSLAVEPGLPATVETDRTALAQILGNLLANALKHAAGAVTLAARPGRGAVILEVADDGAGIGSGADALRPDPDTGDAGRGRGLAIARALASGLGASLVVAPRDGGGTLARLVLPAAAAGAGRRSPARRTTVAALRRRLRRLRARETADLAGRSVLVVDDSLVGRMLMMTILESFDMRVVAVASAVEAAAEVRRRRPDAVCTDWALKDETGADVRRRIAEACADPPPLIVVTGAGTAARLKAGGARDLAVVRKPFTPRELHRALAAAILGPEAASHAG